MHYQIITKMERLKIILGKEVRNNGDNNLDGIIFLTIELLLQWMHLVN